MMQFDIKNQTFDWLEAGERHLAILVNACFEQESCNLLIEDGIIETINLGLKLCKDIEGHKLVKTRFFNLLSKLVVSPKAITEILRFQDIVVRFFLYSNPSFKEFYSDSI